MFFNKYRVLSHFSKSRLIVSKFNNKICFQYNNLLGRPVDSISINTLINTDLVNKKQKNIHFHQEILKVFKYDLGLSWGQSVFYGSITIRLMCSIVKFVLQVRKFTNFFKRISFQRIKFKHYAERKLIKKTIDEVFMADLKNDIRFFVKKKTIIKLKFIHNLLYRKKSRISRNQTRKK